MRILKYLLGILVILFTLFYASWYFVTSKVTTELNKISDDYQISKIDGKEYHISFKDVNSSGFPFSFKWTIDGYQERTNNFIARYINPISLGYNIISGEIFLSYKGKILIEEEEEKKIDVGNYNVIAKMPITLSLISELSNLKDPFQILSHVKEVSILNEKVDSFLGKKKIYSSKYEKLNFGVIHQKQYENLEDFLSHIPNHYDLKYEISRDQKVTKAEEIIFPQLLAYIPSSHFFDMDIKMHVELDSTANEFKEITENSKMNFELDSYSDPKNILHSLIQIDSLDDREIKVDLNGKTTITQDDLLNLELSDFSIESDSLSPEAIDMILQFVDIIKDILQYSFDYDENTKEFDFILNALYSWKNGHYARIDDFGIFSGESGIKLQHEIRMANEISFNGNLLLKNYAKTVNFFSGYICQKNYLKKSFNKELCIDLAKDFIKSISDHPDSKSKDLSFEYNFNSLFPSKGTIGSVKIHQIPRLYYQKIFNKLIDQNNLSKLIEKTSDIINKSK